MSTAKQYLTKEALSSLIVCLLLVLLNVASAFSHDNFHRSRRSYSSSRALPSAMSASSSTNKEIYEIPNSGWASPSWNWGSASGTGHDCAMICRTRWSTREARVSLIQALLDPAEFNREPPFEEVKLIIGLAWQNGRWDGSDGGSGGYGEVLSEMAQAQRYEKGNDDEGSILLIQDMQDRFGKLPPDAEDQQIMKLLLEEHKDDIDVARRKCAGLVLNAMGFAESGL